MKRFLTMVVLCFLIKGVAFGFSWKDAIEDSYLGKDMITPVCSTRSLVVLDFYVVGGGTETSITADVGTSSITITTVSGKYPGTFYWELNTGSATIAEASQYFADLQAASTVTAGIPGGIVLTVRDNVYGGNDTSSMTVTTTNINIHSSTNTKSLSTDAIIGYEYTLDSVTNKKNFVTACETIATFGSGTTILSIYDGDDATGALLYQRTLVTATWLDVDIDGPGDYLPSTKGNAIFVQVYNSANAAVTANILNLRAVVR